jgi:hypothetical protein
MITETEQIAQALDEAARRWPGDRHERRRLVIRLIEEGHRALREERENTVAARLEAIRATSGVLTGAYEEGYLERLREDWPE